MADNYVANAGSGGNTFASDEIGAVHYPRVKLVHGADGVNAGDVASANALPVTDATAQSSLAAINTKTPDFGLTPFKLIAAGTTNATSVKGTAGKLYGWTITNSSTAAKRVKLYNKASAPTVGTDVPVLTLEVPAASGAILGKLERSQTRGINFSTGIALATTNGQADADTAAVTAGDLVINLEYV